MRTLKLLSLSGLLWLAAGTGAWAQATVNYGVAAGPSHSAQISWTASVSAGITSYNVYRSDVSGSGYKLLGSTGSTVLQYQDQGLPAGKTYYYVLTAVASGGESVFSSQVTAVVPTP